MARRLKRCVGVVLLLCHPMWAPWGSLSALLDFVYKRESQLLDWDSQSVLRGLRRLGREGPEPFGALCIHLHTALESVSCADQSDQEHFAFLDFLRLTSLAGAACADL